MPTIHLTTSTDRNGVLWVAANGVPILAAQSNYRHDAVDVAVYDGSPSPATTFTSTIEVQPTNADVALDALAEVLNDHDWTEDMFNGLADLVRKTGRTVS